MYDPHRSTEQPLANEKQTILFVDDEEAIRELGEELLTMEGFNVISASSGLEAIEIYTHRMDEISMVVLDLIMPHMSGRQCMRKLVDINSDVKVLIASGYYSSDPSITQSMLALAKGIIRKPYTGEELLSDIHRVLLD